MRLSQAWKTHLCALLLALAALAAYWNSFHGVFLFDDEEAILKNATLRHFKPFWAPFHPPPGGYTVSGRPLLNFSFALNYAAGRYSPFGYHLVNLAIHILAGWTLFGVVRRTFEQKALRPRFGKDATALGFAVALLWTLHPIQTESVTYIVQRAESLAALFYLLVVYAFIRGTEPNAWRGWLPLSVVLCFLGVGIKETAATAPLLILLYDRAYLSKSFWEAVRKRWRFYLALALSWVPLALLLHYNPDRGGTAGFNVNDTGLQFARIQTCVILHYIYLAFWPLHLVFDYGIQSMPLRSLIVQIILLGLLLAGALLLYRQRPHIGFWALWFFLILAPSSSFVAIATQTAAEHRMYLPLAGLIVLVCMGLYRLTGRRLVLFLLLVLFFATFCGTLTFRRNALYKDRRSLWQDTLRKNPGNIRASMSLAQTYYDQGRFEEALTMYQKLVRPHSASTRMMVAATLSRLNRPVEALRYYQEASAIDSTHYELPYSFGTFYLNQGQLENARKKLQEAISLKPDSADLHETLGFVLLLEGKAPSSRSEFSEALRLDPYDKDMQRRIARYQSALDP